LPSAAYQRQHRCVCKLKQHSAKSKDQQPAIPEKGRITRGPLRTVSGQFGTGGASEINFFTANLNQRDKHWNGECDRNKHCPRRVRIRD
jgi:hypothetical protein